MQDGDAKGLVVFVIGSKKAGCDLRCLNLNGYNLEAATSTHIHIELQHVKRQPSHNPEAEAAGWCSL
jgi:hypothetical protein